MARFELRLPAKFFKKPTNPPITSVTHGDESQHRIISGAPTSECEFFLFYQFTTNKMITHFLYNRRLVVSFPGAEFVCYGDYIAGTDGKRDNHSSSLARDDPTLGRRLSAGTGHEKGTAAPTPAYHPWPQNENHSPDSAVGYEWYRERHNGRPRRGHAHNCQGETGLVSRTTPQTDGPRYFPFST